MQLGFVLTGWDGCCTMGEAHDLPVLVDRVSALGGNAGNRTVRYTLVEGSSLALAPALQQNLAQWRDKVIKIAS